MAVGNKYDFSLNQSIDSVLSRSSFFSNLNSNQLTSIKKLCKFEQFSRGKKIYNAGEASDKLYVLVDGIVRLTLILGNRHAPGVDILNRGELFGWASLLEKTKNRIATAQCLSFSVVLVIDGQEMKNFMEMDHELGFVLMKKLNELITEKLTAFVSG